MNSLLIIFCPFVNGVRWNKLCTNQFSKLLMILRREGDSNPRDPKGPYGFQGRRNRPLCHPSKDNTNAANKLRTQRFVQFHAVSKQQDG